VKRESYSRRHVKKSLLTYVPINNAEGRVIAHPDFGVRKSLRDLSSLAQVDEARTPRALTTRALTGSARIARDMNDQKVVAVYARVAGLGWLVFVELPIEEWTN
jgi:hypothetical protein